MQRLLRVKCDFMVKFIDCIEILYWEMEISFLEYLD